VKKNNSNNNDNCNNDNNKRNLIYMRIIIYQTSIYFYELRHIILCLSVLYVLQIYTFTTKRTVIEHTTFYSNKYFVKIRFRQIFKS